MINFLSQMNNQENPEDETYFSKYDIQNGGNDNFAENDASTNEELSKKSLSCEKVDYENKFGNLYKTFDAKFIKERIWESILNTKSNVSL